ncbi:collagen triple helix repeat-containing protein 1-like [Xenia sp. Carnegie-2017]|uniref:collagen triple helix repeat-containing protein 1-like n=1 Tax=Xenia sp. Carnegie-2017 TaxID=2897299 RepID=UPI001F03F74A|nr:collagen triple helix repeat-containing protein 1-like [Xenia sp. Carnegie-2017]
MKFLFSIVAFLIFITGHRSLVESSSCYCNCNHYGSSSIPRAQHCTSPTRLVKQCVFKNLNDDKDAGALTQVTCAFNKQKTDTSLRVTFNGNMRVVGCSSGCCRRWFITINGRECQDPATIDTQIFADGSVNRHSPSTLDGFCNNIPVGTVKVGLSIAACSGFTGGNAYTGWNSVSRIVIEELSII